MTTIAIHLHDDQVARLAETARRLNISVEELAAAGVLELLAEPDENFEQAARRVVEKNRELYRRLA